MSNITQKRPDFGHLSFARTFIIPAFWVFAVPVFSLFFFHYAQTTYDDILRTALLASVQNDNQATAEEKAEATLRVQKISIEELMDDPVFAAGVDSQVKFEYGTFRWMKYVSRLSIFATFVVFLLGLTSVLLSYRSQQMQYYSLLSGWNVLRLFGALQAILQGTLIVALSYWVTALLMNVYVPKLIIVAAVIAVAAVCYVIKAIFTSPPDDFTVEGEIIGHNKSDPIWQELKQICQKLGTEPPDHIVAGIDSNFFVTEHAVKVGDQTLRGRILYVSLSLLKQLDGQQADAVLAHEMAHFSGEDTVYSMYIAPMLMRFDQYLAALKQGVVTLPIYYFMLCFRGMFEWSISKQSRTREFRADGIAAALTSPEAAAGALARIEAYCTYRGNIEKDLFEREDALEIADISQRIEDGFESYASEFQRKADREKHQSFHPFDSHPPLEQRLNFLRIPFDSPTIADVLNSDVDGRWFELISGSDELEQKMWTEYEDRFKNFHLQSLAWRYLPEGDAQREVVQKFFPDVTYEGGDGVFKMNFAQMTFEKWKQPIYFSEVKTLQANEDQSQLTIEYIPAGETKKVSEKLKLKKFKVPGHAAVLQAIGIYYGRYQAANDYQKHLAAKQQLIATTKPAESAPATILTS